MGSVIGVLKQFKQAVDDCKATYAEARELAKAVDTFEVTLMMIPSTSSGTDDDYDDVGANDDETNERVMKDGDGGADGEESNERGKKKMDMGTKEDEPFNMVAYFEKTPKSVILTIFTLSDNDPFFKNKLAPADTMKHMKEAKIGKERKYSDLEVMFAGMKFIVSGCMEAIISSTKTIQDLKNIGPMSYSWMFDPWKYCNYCKIMAIKKGLASHKVDLIKQTEALRTAIGVASYAVQLEQLERVLDATSAFKHRDMQVLWRTKLGSDKSKVPIGEFCEVYLSTMYDKPPKGESQLDNIRAKNTITYVSERIIGLRGESDVLLDRALSLLYNANGDTDVSVYEVSKTLKRHRVDPTKSSKDWTLKKIFDAELTFLKNNNFRFLKLLQPGGLP